LKIFVWVVVGFTAVYLGNQLSSRKIKDLARLMLGLSGVLGEGWCYFIRTSGVNGLHPGSHYVAILGTFVLLIY
jgi:uncharacterized membrane protein YeaQ/YmgE (transglycosylase-associated protein family)